jgi:hypothetical protein
MDIILNADYNVKNKRGGSAWTITRKKGSNLLPDHRQEASGDAVRAAMKMQPYRQAIPDRGRSLPAISTQ